MRITLKSPAAGHSAGDTANVREDYARWLVSQGYAVEASTSTQHEQDVTQNTSSEATRTRRTKRGDPKMTQRDDDAE